MKEHILGPAHPEVAETLHRLGEVASAANQYTAADQRFTRAQDIVERARVLRVPG